MNLNSNRLLIGHFERSDLEQWFLIESDLEVRKYIHDGSVLNREQSLAYICLLYTSPSPRDLSTSRMPSSA